MHKNQIGMTISVLVLFILPVVLFAQDNLAVLNLDHKGVSETEASVITDRLRINLFETGKFTVIEREKMEDILSEQKFQMTGCTSTECVIEAGNILGVALMVETGEIKNTAVYDVKGEIDELLGGVNNIALELAGIIRTENHISKDPIVIDSNMVLVEGGSFTMGDTWGDGNKDEKPTHSVTLSDYYIGKYPITQKEWYEVMGKNPSEKKGVNMPVYRIDWYDAVKFCNNRSIMDGLKPCYMIDGKNTKCDFEANGYRLPTEAEWEFAAKGGVKSKDYRYSGSNESDEVGWTYHELEGNIPDVGQKKPNELGIYDMTGLIAQWCWDWYDNYNEFSEENPTGPTKGRGILSLGDTGRVARGSCNSCRIGTDPNNNWFGLGLRVVISATK